MRCERCGADIQEESSYCGQCGAPKPAPATSRGAATVAQSVQEPAAVPIAIEPSIQADKPSGSNNGRTCLWIGVGCAVFIVIMLCVILALVFPLMRSIT